MKVMDLKMTAPLVTARRLRQAVVDRPGGPA